MYRVCVILCLTISLYTKWAVKYIQSPFFIQKTESIYVFMPSEQNGRMCCHSKQTKYKRPKTVGEFIPCIFPPLSPKLFPLQLYNPLTRSGWYLGCAEFVFLITSTWANPPEKLLLWYKNSRMITFPHAIRPVHSGKYFTPLKVKCAWRWWFSVRIQPKLDSMHWF